MKETFIESIFNSNKAEIRKANFAIYDAELGELILRKTVWKGTSFISLKDVEYLIKNGILYIKGTRLFYTYINRIVAPMSYFKKPYLYLYNFKEVNLNSYGLEPIEFTTYETKYFFGLIKEKYDKIYNADKHGYWLKMKKEEEFLYTLHPFKLQE